MKNLYSKAWAKAKETKKPVKMGIYSVDCNKPLIKNLSGKKCYRDLVTISVMPDGRMKEERCHTFRRCKISIIE